MINQRRGRTIIYWITTGLVTAELALGGVWDILQLPFVSSITKRLGYPSYFLVIIGIWKLLGAVALLVPRFPILKEWAYAGAVFNYTGAIASLLVAGNGFAEMVYPAFQLILVFCSWITRPSSRVAAKNIPAA
jgi:hypothetical protein